MEYSQFLTLLLAVVLAVAVVFVFSMGVLISGSKVNPKKPKKKTKAKPKEKAEMGPQKLECALGKKFGYLRTLEKHDIISDKCHNDCPSEVREACLDPRKAEKLLKEMRKI